MVGWAVLFILQVQSISIYLPVHHFYLGDKPEEVLAYHACGPGCIHLGRNEQDKLVPGARAFCRGLLLLEIPYESYKSWVQYLWKPVLVWIGTRHRICQSIHLRSNFRECKPPRRRFYKPDFGPVVVSTFPQRHQFEWDITFCFDRFPAFTGYNYYLPLAATRHLSPSSVDGVFSALLVLF